MSDDKRKDKGLYICPNNHMYNANKYGDTCPNCGAKQQDKKKTPEEYAEELTLTPEQWVYGWLVCIEGVNKGRSYEIRNGKNFIGSDPNMDIYIKGDLGIEPINHAVIIYDEKERKTQILASMSQGMIYLKKKAIYELTILESYAELEIGSSKFHYLEYCSSRFDWSDLADN